MLKDTMLFVDGHGLVAPVRDIKFRIENRNHWAHCHLTYYSIDVLCLFGVAEGLYVPFRIRALRNDLYVDLEIPGVVQELTENDDHLILDIELNNRPDI